MAEVVNFEPPMQVEKALAIMLREALRDMTIALERTTASTRLRSGEDFFETLGGIVWPLLELKLALETVGVWNAGLDQQGERLLHRLPAAARRAVLAHAEAMDEG